MDTFIHILYVVITFIGSLIILPFFLPILLIFRIYRHSVMGLIRKFRPDVDLVTYEDSAWLQDSPENPAIINSVIEFQGTPDIERLRKHFNSCLVELLDENGDLLIRKAKQYADQMLHRYVWINDRDFDIKNHVTMYKGPTPKSIQELKDVAGDICSKPFPEKSAMWTLTIIPGPLDGGNIFHAIFRVHHAMADGISLVRLLMEKIVDVPPEQPSIKRFGTNGKFAKAVMTVLKAPSILLEKLFLGADDNALHGPALTGRKMVTWSKGIKLDLIKKVKNATKTTVNDVLMACLSGAMSQHFKNNGKTTPEEVKAYVPVDIRPPSSKLNLDNQFGMVILPLPVADMTGMDRLFQTKSRMDKVKQSPEPIIGSLFVRYCMGRLPNWLTKMSFDWLSSKCTLVLSNVPGPQKKVSISGYPINGMVFWPPQRGSAGVGISILSYDGWVRVGVLADRAILTQADGLMEAFERQVMNLAEELKIS